MKLNLLGAVARSGFVRLYYPVLEAGIKAKSVTTCPETSGNNLPILSVLGIVFYYSPSTVTMYQNDLPEGNRN